MLSLSLSFIIRTHVALKTYFKYRSACYIFEMSCDKKPETIDDSKEKQEEKLQFLRLEVPFDVVVSLLTGVIMGSYLLNMETYNFIKGQSQIALFGYKYLSNGSISDPIYFYADWRDPIDCSMCLNLDKIPQFSSGEMTKELFERMFITGATPLIIRGASIIRDPNIISLGFFRDLYDEESRAFHDNGGEDCEFFSDTDEFKKLGQFLGEMNEDRFWMRGDFAPWYVGWSNCEDKIKRILTEQHVNLPDFLQASSRDDEESYDYFFMGSPGEGSPMHLDLETNCSWQTQIYGIKEWKVKAPIECRRGEGLFGLLFGSFRGLCSDDEMTGVLNPGDMIILNTDWWEHGAHVKEGGVSISMTGSF